MHLNPDECPICLEECTAALESSSLTCGHTMCRKCAKKCLQRSAFCPMCKEPVYRMTPRPEYYFLNPHSSYGLSLSWDRVCARIVVTEVVLGSTADIEGLMVGDEILAVNDELMSDAMSAREILLGARSQQRFMKIDTTPRLVLSVYTSILRRCTLRAVASGVLVHECPVSSPLRRGDVIVACDGRIDVRVHDFEADAGDCGGCLPWAARRKGTDDVEHRLVVQRPNVL